MGQIIKIIPRGTNAVTNNETIPGVILAACIRGDVVTYEFSYFYGGKYETAWLSEDEFTVESKQRKQIGFKQ